jgi:hypothetical protein
VLCWFLLILISHLFTLTVHSPLPNYMFQPNVAIIRFEYMWTVSEKMWLISVNKNQHDAISNRAACMKDDDLNLHVMYLFHSVVGHPISGFHTAVKMSVPEDGGSMFHPNVGKLLLDYTVLQPRRQPSSYTSPREPKISPTVVHFYTPAGDWRHDCMGIWFSTLTVLCLK